MRLLMSDATWAGMYADQLDLWSSVFSHGRFLVMQYERVRENPQMAAEKVWNYLKLDAVTLSAVTRPSRTANRTEEWEFPLDLRRQLIALYGPQVSRLHSRWGISPSLWPNFT